MFLLGGGGTPHLTGATSLFQSGTSHFWFLLEENQVNKRATDSRVGGRGRGRERREEEREGGRDGERELEKETGRGRDDLTHKHGLVLCVSDCSLHHVDHVLMGNHLLRMDTHSLHTPP